MRWALPVVVLLTALMPAVAAAQGFEKSPFERDFGDIKYLDSYFGIGDSKAEVSPGDLNVPFTIVLANVGAHDITGIRGELSLPYGFTPSETNTMVARSDSDTNSRAGEIFYLTFYLDVAPHVNIQQYPMAAKVEFSRLWESGARNIFFDFYVMVPGSGIPDLEVPNAFLTSLQTNTVSVRITNEGTAPLSNADVTIRVPDVGGQTMTPTEQVVVYDSHWDIGNVEPGGFVDIEVRVYVPETIHGSALRLPLELNYIDANGNPVTIQRGVDFYVRGLIDLSIYGVDTINISDVTMIVGNIINEGNVDALFTFVSVEPVDGSNIIPQTQFLDEVETDSPVPFNIPLEFEGESQYGEHDIQISVRYKDDIREEHILTHNATINLAEPPPEPSASVVPSLTGQVGGDGSDQFVMLIAGIVIAVILAIVVVRQRRRED